jgi:hypothetical protein
VAFAPIKGAAFSEVTPIDDLYLYIDGAPIRESSRGVEDGKLRLRVRPVKIAANEFQIDDSVVVLKHENCVEKGYQEYFTGSYREKIPHETVVESVDSIVAYVDDFKGYIVI